MKREAKTIILIGALLPALISPAPAPAGGPGLSTVRFATTGRVGTDWHFFVAKERRIFQKNGIYVEDIIIQGAPNATRAVISNTVPLGRINPDFVVDAIEKGAKVRIISGDMGKIPYDLMARPEIQSGTDLRGKIIGVSSLTGGTTLMVKEVLERAYKLTDKDYQLLVVGTSPDRYAALKGGSVAATFMAPPFNIRAQREGYRKLVTFHEVLGPIQFVASFAHEDYLRSNRPQVVGYVKSMIEATRWLYDGKNKEEAIAIYTGLLKTTREAAETDYRFLVEEFKPWPADGSVNPQAMEKTMELRVKAGRYEGKKAPSYTQYADLSIVEEAKRDLGQQP